MNSVKQPKWDKQQDAPIIVANPDGPNKNPSFSEPLKVGQHAVGTIGGVEVTVRLTDVLGAARAQGEVVEIMDGQNERDSAGDLSKGDTVVIDRKDMYCLYIDTDGA